MAKVEKKCLTCGRQFQVHPYRKDTAKYCSVRCRGIAHRGKYFGRTKPKIEKTCPVCGKIFSVYPSLTRVKYCSTSCAHIALLKYFPKLEPSPELAYILGVLKGDGSCSKYMVRLGTKTPEFNFEFEKNLKAIGLNPKTRYSEKWNRWDTRACSRLFAKWYKNLKIEDFRRILATREMKQEFIRGFYESEGTKYRIDKNGFRLGFSNTNRETMMLVQEILRDLGYNFNLGFEHSANRKDIFVLRNAKRSEVCRFIEEIHPVIKR